MPRRIGVFGSEGRLYISGTIGRRPDGEMKAFMRGKMQAVTVASANVYVGQIGEMGEAVFNLAVYPYDVRDAFGTGQFSGAHAQVDRLPAESRQLGSGFRYVIG